jgi:predicted Zn-dependent protease
MGKKKKRRPLPPRDRPPSPRLAAQLAEVQELVERGRFPEAEELLATLEHRHPNQSDVLALRLSVAVKVEDLPTQQEACERLIALRPGQPKLQLLLAGSYLQAGRPALAFRAFRSFLERWPDHPEAVPARRALTQLEPEFRRHLEEIGLGGPDDLQLAAWHEEVQVHLERGENAQARRTAEQLLRVRPEFAPALNNTAEAYSREGDYEQALAAARRVLAFDPNNIHALANLARYLCLAARQAEAAEAAGRLRAVTPANPEGWLKVAEALSCLGDDAGVLEATAAAQRSGNSWDSEGAAFLEHLAGVAAYRQGREADARRHWKQALRHQPDDPLAQANLDDLRQPAGQRHAAWPFDLGYWVAERVVLKLVTRLGHEAERQDEQGLRQKVREVLREHPNLTGLIPVLLDRGDPLGRTMALNLAMGAETPALQAALRDFALGQRGPDDQRLQAGQVAADAGLIPAGPLRMWAQGEWRDVLMLSFELQDTPSGAHPPEVANLATEAYDLLQARDGVGAERLFLRALEKAPDAPDLLNNLALAYQVQKRWDEAEALVRRAHARHPDYWFGRVGMARLATEAGRLDEASSLLEPLLRRRRVHLSEFVALAMAQIDLLLARGEKEGARTWLQMWADLLPDHPALPEWRRRVRGLGIWNWFMGRGRK